MTLAEDPAASETWRDPFVFRDPGGDGWHMLITARAPGAPRLRDGVVGHARSSDMLHWDLQPPLTTPAGFGEIEVPQVRVIDGTPLLTFCCHPEEQSADQIARFGRFCTWYVLGDSVLGPWDIDAARPFEAEPSLFAAPLAQRHDGSWAFVGFRNTEPEGIVPDFELLDPIPVELSGGVLRRVRRYGLGIGAPGRRVLSRNGTRRADFASPMPRRGPGPPQVGKARHGPQRPFVPPTGGALTPPARRTALSPITRTR